jgi:hypothetical protein
MPANPTGAAIEGDCDRSMVFAAARTATVAHAEIMRRFIRTSVPQFRLISGTDGEGGTHKVQAAIKTFGRANKHASVAIALQRFILERPGQFDGSSSREGHLLSYGRSIMAIIGRSEVHRQMN